MFQSPCGDSLFSDHPRQGIAIIQKQKFQSPCGDSLFSDHKQNKNSSGNMTNLFQSPCGDSLFSDDELIKSQLLTCEGFNPLAGIRCFLTYVVSCAL